MSAVCIQAQQGYCHTSMFSAQQVPQNMHPNHSYITPTIIPECVVSWLRGANTPRSIIVKERNMFLAWVMVPQNKRFREGFWFSIVPPSLPLRPSLHYSIPHPALCLQQTHFTVTSDASMSASPWPMTVTAAGSSGVLPIQLTHTHMHKEREKISHKHSEVLLAD